MTNETTNNFNIEKVSGKDENPADIANKTLKTLTRLNDNSDIPIGAAIELASDVARIYEDKK